MKQLCRASSYYQLRIGRTVKVATRTREAERKVRGRDARASRLRGSRPSRQSGKVLSQAQGAVFSSRRARRVPVSEPSRQSDTPGVIPSRSGRPIRITTRTNEKCTTPCRSALRLRSAVSAYTRLNAMANVAICAARRRGPNNVLITYRNSRKKPVLTTLNCSSDVLLKPLTDVVPALRAVSAQHAAQPQTLGTGSRVGKLD